MTLLLITERVENMYIRQTKWEEMDIELISVDYSSLFHYFVSFFLAIFSFWPNEIGVQENDRLRNFPLTSSSSSFSFPVPFAFNPPTYTNKWLFDFSPSLISRMMLLLLSLLLLLLARLLALGRTQNMADKFVSYGKLQIRCQMSISDKPTKYYLQPISPSFRFCFCASMKV